MNVQQINNIRYLNQNNNASYNNQYYKTEPMENDSISFKGLPIQRWKIPQANTGLKKMLFGTGLSAAAVWAIEKGFNFIPFTEEEITRATSSNTEKQVTDIPVPKKLDTEKLDMYNIPILYDKEEISKLKGDNLVNYIREKGIKLDYDSRVSGYHGGAARNYHYVLPLIEGTKLTIEDKEITVPKGHVCLDEDGYLRVCSFYQFHHSTPMMATHKLPINKPEKRDEYLQFMNLPYYNEDGNIEIADISEYDCKHLRQEEYNNDGQLISIGSNCQNVNYEYNDNGQLIKVVYGSSKNSIETNYFYDNNTCTKTMKAYKGGFEVLYDEECTDVQEFQVNSAKGYKKDNLTVTCLNPDRGSNESGYLEEDTLKEIDKTFQAELKKNPKLSQYDIFIDMYKFGGIFETVYKPIVTVKDKETGEIISIKQGLYKDKNNHAQTSFGLDNI